ncbi:hypothetical protein E0L36_02600 [Streptomyces sp. AJS327]|nr:hypothetical protein [Streptomyces sp. AJS327]
MPLPRRSAVRSAVAPHCRGRLPPARGFPLPPDPSPHRSPRRSTASRMPRAAPGAGGRGGPGEGVTETEGGGW